MDESFLNESWKVLVRCIFSYYKLMYLTYPLQQFNNIWYLIYLFLVCELQIMSLKKKEQKRSNLGWKLLSIEIPERNTDLTCSDVDHTFKAEEFPSIIGNSIRTWGPYAPGHIETVYFLRISDHYFTTNYMTQCGGHVKSHYPMFLSIKTMFSLDF